MVFLNQEVVQVVRKGPSGLIKNDKGQWVKPGKDSSALKAQGAAFSNDPQRFIPEKQWQGERLGYYFTRGQQGVGYYADKVQGNTWKDTWMDMHVSWNAVKAAEEEAARKEAQHARERQRNEVKSQREDRRTGIHDPDDYVGSRCNADRDSDFERKHDGDYDDHRQRDRDEYRRQHSGDRYREYRGSYDRDRFGNHGDREHRGEKRSREEETEGTRRDRDVKEVSPKSMTKEEREAAALARLAAKRNQGQGARIGGIQSMGSHGLGRFGGGGGGFRP